MREPDADLVEHVENRVPPRGEVEVARVDHPAEAGGNIATYFQIDDPVNPTTVDTPSRAAVRAAFLTASAARRRTPSASPSPQTEGARMP